MNKGCMKIDIEAQFDDIEAILQGMRDKIYCDLPFGTTYNDNASRLKVISEKISLIRKNMRGEGGEYCEYCEYRFS